MASLRIGGKLRRLRQERRLSQVQMAAELEISPSYLNLIESNQRPLTAPVLLRLARKFDIQIGDLSSDDDGHITSELMEALSDPLFDEQDVKASDVRDLIATLPKIAKSFIALYRSHRSLRARAYVGDSESTAIGEDVLSRVPSEEVSDFIQLKMNYFPDIERAATALWEEEGLSEHALPYELVSLLARRFAVQVDILPVDEMCGLSRRFDPIRRRLELSELLPPASRAFQLARQVALAEHSKLIDYLAAGGKFTSAESDALARSALANYFAAALMMPYARFVAAAKSTRYNLDVLQARFGASFEQVCHRLTTLREPGNSGIPFHLLRVDVAGNISKRFSASGIRIARFGAACPKWSVYEAFTSPGVLRVQVSRMPDGETFFCIARTVGGSSSRAAPGRLSQSLDRRAIALGCSIRHAPDIVYSDSINLDDQHAITPIGVSCPACPRPDCGERAAPALSQMPAY